MHIVILEEVDLPEEKLNCWLEIDVQIRSLWGLCYVQELIWFIIE